MLNPKHVNRMGRFLFTLEWFMFYAQFIQISYFNKISIKYLCIQSQQNEKIFHNIENDEVYRRWYAN